MSDSSQVLDFMSERISFVNKISVILKATSDDDSPIPGYMYKQISDVSHESFGYCESLLEFLVERLDKKSYHVKLKVLKLMKYIIENGHANFAIGLRKMSHGIRAATKFGGPPDPLHGNVPYAMVRKEAQNICEKLFNVEDNSAEELTEETSTTYSTGGMGSVSVSSGGGRIEGFGNYLSNQPKSLGDTIIDSIGKFAEHLSETASDRQKVLLDSLEKSPSQYCPPVIVPLHELTTHEPADKTASSRKLPRKHIPGRAGGGWDDSGPADGLLRDGGGHDSRSDGSSELTERLESMNLTVSDWNTEDELVNVTVGDVSTSLLTRAEITTFQNKCAAINCEKIIEFLKHKLSCDLEYIILKSLLLIENFLHCDLVGVDVVACMCEESLVNVYRKWEGPCRAKARKIIRILEKLTSHRHILIVEENGTALSVPPDRITDKQTFQPDQMSMGDNCGLTAKPLLSVESESLSRGFTETEPASADNS